MFFVLRRAFIYLSGAERRVFFLSCIVFLVSLGYLSVSWFLANTTIAAVRGGNLIEGAVGQPTYVNPILSDTAISNDLAALAFANLPSLAESIKVGANGRTYTVRLKDGLLWSDGMPIVSDDVVFTVSAIQNPETHSPLYVNFLGTEVKRISERELEFTLDVPYAFFSNTLAVLRPAPQHVFGSIPPENLRLSGYNLEPVGSGPMKFGSISKRKDGFITEYIMVRNQMFSGTPPYLDRITFRFYETASALRDAFNRGEVHAFLASSPEGISGITISHRLVLMPSAMYYAVFFNPYSNLAISDKSVRKALISAINKEKIVEEVWSGNAEVVRGPLLPQMYGYAPEVYPQSEFSKSNAELLLERAGYALISTTTADGQEVQIRAKRGREAFIKMSFTIVVPDTPSLNEVARLIQSDLASIGVRLQIRTVDAAALDEIIQRRDYEMILFGHVLGNNPDLFAFWHSSQKMYPGLNLALYESSIADTLIEASRRETLEEKLKRTMTSLQSQIIQDAPAVFLLSPSYAYVARNNVRGVVSSFTPTQSDRFANISQIYVRAVRVFR